MIKQRVGPLLQAPAQLLRAHRRLATVGLRVTCDARSGESVLRSPPMASPGSGRPSFAHPAEGERNTLETEMETEEDEFRISLSARQCAGRRNPVGGASAIDTGIIHSRPVTTRAGTAHCSGKQHACYRKRGTAVFGAGREPLRPS